MNKQCFCGCDEFHVQKKTYQYSLICTRCKCTRDIISPGVRVQEYDVNISFKQSNKALNQTEGLQDSPSAS